jgi:hypothetical protein
VTSTYAIAAVRARPDGGPVRPWHAADMLDDPAEHVGEVVTALCGVSTLQVFAVAWSGPMAQAGCPDCRLRLGLRGH